MKEQETTMDPYRTNKLSQSILEVLSQLLQVSVKDPRVGFVTLNAVELNRDHSVARVFFSVMGDEEDRRKSLLGLKKARGFMQSKLARTLGLRAAPQLRFEYDDSVERGLTLDTVLDGLADRGEFLTEDEKKRQLTLDDLTPPAELVTGLREAETVWVVPHHNPDPDAVGSALALGEALEAMGRRVRILAFPDPPVNLTDMVGFDKVLMADEAAAVFAEDEPDTVVLVDCHRLDRTGPLEDVLTDAARHLCIDHHVVSGRKAALPGWVEARACSCCTLVYRVIEELAAGDAEHEDEPFAMTLDMATNLYAGLLNDTGGFRFDNTLPFTFEFAGRLSALGVDTAKVARTTLFRHRREGIDLMQRVLATLDYHEDGRIALMHVDRAMLEATGGAMGDTEGFVNIATSVDGVDLVGFIKEIDDETWRVSLRVRREGDVQAVAARHGGGGHRMAAGCTLEGSLDEVKDLLARDLAAALER
jgi:phosphoesterase RecJ-like protein